MASESSPRGWYLVAIVPIYFGKLYISMAHIIHDREIWGICKGYVEGWYTGLCPRYGGFFHWDMSISLLSSRYWRWGVPH